MYCYNRFEIGYICLIDWLTYFIIPDENPKGLLEALMDGGGSLLTTVPSSRPASEDSHSQSSESDTCMYYAIQII